jgi:hypothetical protein
MQITVFQRQTSNPLEVAHVRDAQHARAWFENKWGSEDYFYVESNAPIKKPDQHIEGHEGLLAEAKIRREVA